MTDREIMKQALEALGLVVWTNNPPVNAAIAALRERLAREEPTRAEKMREAGYTRRPSLREFPSDKPARQEQEPVAWRYRGNLHEFDPSDWAEGPVTPLYTAPRREWVGLTEEDFSAINQSCLTKLQAATSAESILKEKNNA